MEPDASAWGVDETRIDYSGRFGSRTSPEVKQRLGGMFDRIAQRQEERLARELENAAKPKITTFTTQYAVDWGKRMGWRIRDRERFDARLKRHHDLMMGVDVLFSVDRETRRRMVERDERWRGIGGLVGIQAAGRGERAVHYKRFEDAGGAEEARDMGITVLYMIFERGNPEPVSVESWT